MPYSIQIRGVTLTLETNKWPQQYQNYKIVARVAVVHWPPFIVVVLHVLKSQEQGQANQSRSWRPLPGDSFCKWTYFV